MDKDTPNFTIALIINIIIFIVIPLAMAYRRGYFFNVRERLSNLTRVFSKKKIIAPQEWTVIKIRPLSRFEKSQIRKIEVKFMPYNDKYWARIAIMTLLSICCSCAQQKTTSEQPYEVWTTESDQLLTYKTFTPQWKLSTDGMQTATPAKLSYDDKNGYSIDLYLPDEQSVELLQSAPQRSLVSLWLWLDDDNFFIIFPEYCNIQIDPNNEIVNYHLLLCNTGFHSEKKKLKGEYQPNEICEFVISELSTHNIVSVAPKILSADDAEILCPEVSIQSKTAPMLRQAVEALVAAISTDR